MTAAVTSPSRSRAERRRPALAGGLTLGALGVVFGDIGTSPLYAIQTVFPFFLLALHWARWPIVILATAATVIASQAVITGAFSLAHQAVQLGYLPRLRIAHTSEATAGQIYVPWINWLLMVSVITLVLAFRSSAALAYAFGMAVTATITITTLLCFYLARHRWRTPLGVVLAGGGRCSPSTCSSWRRT